MTDPKREPGRLLSLVAVGAAMLFVGTASIVVLSQTFAPMLGLEAGRPDPVVIGTMLVWAAIALGLLPAAAIISFWRRDR